MDTTVPSGGVVVTVGVGLRGNWVPEPGPEKGGGAEPVRPGRARVGSESAPESGGTAPPGAAARGRRPGGRVR